MQILLAGQCSKVVEVRDSYSTMRGFVYGAYVALASLPSPNRLPNRFSRHYNSYF